MHRRVVSLLIALAAAACGEAFTAATDDGGGHPGDDASLDTGVPGLDGAVASDAASARDAKSEDATSLDAQADDGGHGKDGSIVGLDGGPALDAGVCVRSCPSGFDCIATKCEDRAALHFSATDNRPLNWSYGYAASLGGSFQLDSSHWTPGSSIDVWTNTMANTLEPSVFHNGGLATQMYAEMTIPGEALGLYPGVTGQPSIVRWTAPVTGLYAIDVTFTGISSPVTTVNTWIFLNNAVGSGMSRALNAYMLGNAFTYSAPAQMLAAGTVVDFEVTTIPNRDDPAGGTTLDARITAQ